LDPETVEGEGASLTRQCSGIKRDGGRCTAVVKGSSLEYCYQHDPERAEERRRNASRAGKSSPSRELAGIKRKLSELAQDVLEGSVERGDGAVVSQILNVYLSALSVELKVREVTELEERLEELEASLERQNRTGRHYGA
jgi:hypothetical protein